MITNRYISKIIIVLTAAAVLFCLAGRIYADQLTEYTGGRAVFMEYESKLFDRDQIISVDIQIDEKDWEELLSHAIEENYYACDVNINGTAFFDVGIRTKGNTSLTSIANDPDTDRYSLKLEFDQYVKGQTCFGLDKLVLNNNYADATNMKEAIVYDMYQYLDADASLYNYAKVSVNGEYWGVYLALEAVEESFLLRNYGVETGELYKPENMDGGGERDFGDGNPRQNMPGKGQERSVSGEGAEEQKLTVPGKNSAGENGETPESPGRENGEAPESPGRENGEALESPGRENGEAPESPGRENGEALESPGVENGEAPEFPGGENGEIPESPSGERREISEFPGGESGEAPEFPDGEKAETPESPSGESGEIPEFPGGENGGRPEFPGGEKGRGSRFMGGGGSDLNYTDDELDSYTTIWEGAVTDTTDADHKRVITALNQIHSGANLEEYLDVDAVLKYMAVHTFVVNLDSLSGNMAHNYYLYESDGQLNILPWDYNLSFGGMAMGKNGSASEMVNYPIDTPFSGTQFFDVLLENETYLARYHEYLKQLAEEYVQNKRFDTVYAKIRMQIDDLVKADPTAFYTYDQYDAGAEMLFQTIRLRAESISGQLAGTIPSTADTQREYPDKLTDASEIDLSVMGEFHGGGNHFERENTEVPADLK